MRNLSGPRDYLFAKVTPSIPGEIFGLGGQDINEVVFAARYIEEPLFPISTWPVSVYVNQLLVGRDAIESGIRVDQLRMLAWGELYETIDEAYRLGRP